MSLSFPHRLRLRNRTTFKQVYEQGRFLSNQLIAVHFFPHPDRSQRVGFTAGKRLGNAVVRNRCKRRLKECYRLFQAEAPTGIDMIVVARKSLVNAEWESVVAAFRDLLRRTRTVLAKNG
jgi:ribonuclease P protein component